MHTSQGSVQEGLCSVGQLSYTYSYIESIPHLPTQQWYLKGKSHCMSKVVPSCEHCSSDSVRVRLYLYECPAHLWGRSGCSRTLEWHTALSSAALSCHQQNAQSKPATYCKAQKRMCVVLCVLYLCMCLHVLHVQFVPITHCIRTCVHPRQHTQYAHMHTHTHPDMYLYMYTHKCSCTHTRTHTQTQTHTYSHLPVFKQALLPLLGGL